MPYVNYSGCAARSVLPYRFTREWEGLALAEIGRRLDVSEDAARMRFNRAVRRLARTVRGLRSGNLAESLDE